MKLRNSTKKFNQALRSILNSAMDTDVMNPETRIIAADRLSNQNKPCFIDLAIC